MWMLLVLAMCMSLASTTLSFLSVQRKDITIHHDVARKIEFKNPLIIEKLTRTISNPIRINVDINNVLQEEIFWQDRQGNNTECRIVASSDGNIPSNDILPSLLIKSEFNNILDKLNVLFHAISHNNTNIFQEEEEEVQQQLSVIKKSLNDGGFEILTKRDLDLCEALNAAYLLRLSILPDLKSFNPDLFSSFFSKDEEEMLFDGKILVFRRGYAEEVTTGRLILPKLDYLQASIVQRSASVITRLLSDLEREIRYASVDSLKGIINSLPIVENNTILKHVREQLQNIRDDTIVKQGIPDIRNMLNPFLVCESGYNITTHNTDNKTSYFKLNNNNQVCTNLNYGAARCIYDQQQLTQNNINKGKQLLKRVDITNLVDFFSTDAYRSNLIEGFFSYAKLVEPTYKEIVVIWQPSPQKITQTILNNPPDFVYKTAQVFGLEDMLPKKPDRSILPKPKNEPLKIRAFKDVPMANLLAVLPKTKLVFRQADALVFDSISVASLLAVLASQRYDNPKVDLIALISVVLWLLRTFFRYSNKFARYDLLVNKFLTSRIAYSGDGAIRYLVSDGAEQRARKVGLVYAWLLQVIDHEDYVPITKEELTQIGEIELNKLLNCDQWISIDIDSILQDLEDVNLVNFSHQGLLLDLQGKDDAVMTLREKWASLF